MLSGDKRATSTSLAEYVAAEQELPGAGDLSIVLDGRGEPHALIVTTQVDVVPFDEVDADHALAEGEGDRTLEGWREEHRKYFRRIGLFTEDMRVVLERFEVLYQV